MSRFTKVLRSSDLNTVQNANLGQYLWLVTKVDGTASFFYVLMMVHEVGVHIMKSNVTWTIDVLRTHNHLNG